MTYIGHPIQHKLFHVDKSNVDIPVNIGSNTVEITHYQDLPEWLETKERYMDVFDIFKDKMTFNFHDLEEICPILNTLEQFIKEAGGNGFATKGYHLLDHFKLFDQQYILKDYKYENFFCFFRKENIVMNFTKCGMEPGHALYFASQNFQIMNALHEELQSKDVIQVNVLVNNGDVDFCKGCIDNAFFIHEDVMKDIEKFKSWFNNLQNLINNLRKKTSLYETSSNEDILNNIKKDMITLEALHNTNAFPSFSTLPEDQMDEMPKIIMLTGVQFTIIHTNNKFIFIRGSYGSGKSVVLQNKLDKCIQSMNENDLIYYICHDQQSKYTYFMKSVKDNNPDKHIITCNSTDLPFGKQKPTLSFILNHILHFWKDRTVHIFIDEFAGSYVSRNEIKELEKILPKFRNSNIIISLQSMEENINEDMIDEIDLGYQYDLLEKNTPFVVYNLDYSIRCSFEINEFVKATAEFIEQKDVSMQRVENFYDGDQHMFVDKELGQEMNFRKRDKSCIETKLTYNISDKYGHHLCNGPVAIYVYDKFERKKQQKIINFIKPISITSTIAKFYISALAYILESASDDEKFVICTFDEHIYNSVYYYLEKKPFFLCTWTSKVDEYINGNSKYQILLTDYASVRGYEFPNFIFLLRLGTKYLKYRMIECFTRATTKLHIITDNANISHKSSLDNQLIEIWKSLPCVEYFQCKYNHSKATLKILKDGNLEYSHTVVNVGSSDKFPWSQPKKFDEEIEQKVTDIDLYKTIRYLCENANIEIIRNFFQLHDLDILNYRSGGNESLLHVSSRLSDKTFIRYLIFQCQVDVDVRNRLQQTSLHIAALYGRVEIAEFLIDNKADIHAKDIIGRTSLHQAAEYGQYDMALLLIDNKADIDAQDNRGQTPLHLASLFGHTKIVFLLHSKQANIHAKDDTGRTPLHFAACNGHPDVVDYLIIHMGIEEAQTKDNFGYEPFDCAQLWKQHEVVKLMTRIRKKHMKSLDRLGLNYWKY